MQLPEKVNFNWQSVLQKALLDNTINIHEIVSENSEVAADIKNANASYEYWDKAKYTLLPENISPELFWSILKFRRCGLYVEKIKLGVHAFKYLINPEVLNKLAFVETFNLKTSLSLDEENEYCANAKMEEAIASSRLEGADITKEVAKEMLRTNTAAGNGSEQMVIGNYKALNFVEKNIEMPLSPEFIKQLYTVIMDSSENEIFRKEEQNVRVVDIKDDAVLYEPPKSADIEMLLNSFCDYVNENSGTNHLVKAIIIHFLFAYIHPFNDGNGRIARVLFYWYALKTEMEALRYLAISKVICPIASQYAKAFLYTEIDENDLTYFINFNLDVLLEAVNNFMEFLDESKAHNSAPALISLEVKLNFRQESILREFCESQNIRNIEYFKNKLGIVYETARKDLMYLAKKGLLAKSKKGKEFTYLLSKKSLKKLQENKQLQS